MNKTKLEKDLEMVNLQIEDVKLDDKLDVKKLKDLLKDREAIEFRLWLLGW